MPELFTGRIDIRDASSERVIELDGDTGGISAGGNGKRGQLLLFPEQGDLTRLDTRTIHVNGQVAKVHIGGNGVHGSLFVYPGAGDNENPDQASLRLIGQHAAVYVGTSGYEGDVIVDDGDGREAIRIDGGSAAVYIGTQGNEGDLVIRDQEQRDVLQLNGRTATLSIGAEGNAGIVIVRGGGGFETLRLDGETGDIRLRGADCAEEVDIVDVGGVDPGTVLVIGDEMTFHPCDKSYDKRVAGVVAGASGFKPAIILDRRPERSQRVPMALVGKVYCKADAEYSPIEVGDPLTTSPTVGHAMKAQDTSRGFGTVIGKALGPLAAGRSLIPVLIALQ